MPTASPQSWWRRIVSSLSSRFHRSTPAAIAQQDDRELVFSLSPSRIPSPQQLRFLPRLLSVREQRFVRACVSLAVISILILVGHTIARHVVRAPATGGTLTEGIVGTPQYLNPILARPFTADTDLTHLLFRGLMRTDATMKTVPDLASSLTMSSDGKTYTAKLRPNLVWSDGEPLTADDVRYTFETVADASYQSPQQALFKDIKVTAPDKQTVVFTLPAPVEPFRSYLTLGLLPAHLWQDQTPQTFPLAELNVKPVTNGLYKFQSVTKDRSGVIKDFTFVRNKLALGPRPYIDRVIIKLYPDAVSAEDALASNSIDSYGGIETTNLEKIKKHRDVTNFALSQVTAVFFNEKINVALKSKDVRQALSMSVNRQELIDDTLGNIGRPATGPLLPKQPGYSATANHLATSVDQANALLEKAGWKRGDNGLRSKSNQVLGFSLTTVDDPTYVALAQALAKTWRSIGATVDVKTVAQDRIQKDTVRPRQYDALLFGQIFDTDADPYLLWHSSQQRDPGYALAVAYIKKIDQDLETQRTTTDPKLHDAVLLDFQNVVADEVPAIMLVQNEYLYAHQTSLRGFSTDRIVAPANRFDDIAHWYVNTSWHWK